MGPGVPRERGQLRNGTHHRAGACQEAPTAEAAAGSRSSGKHTRVAVPHRTLAKRGGRNGRARTWGPSASMQSALATTHLLQPSARKTLRALNHGKICAPCMIRGVSAAKRAPPWQDLRAMHSQKAICGAFRIHDAHILPKPARFGCMARESCQEGALFPSQAPFGIHGAQNLPRMAARERIASIFCHGKALGNAQRRYIATTRRPERISRESCHR